MIKLRFDPAVTALTERALLECFCKAHYCNRTVVFANIDEVHNAKVVNSDYIDSSVLEALEGLNDCNNPHWDIGRTVPVIIDECAGATIDLIRKSVYNGYITAIWHNNSLDHYTD